MNEIQRTQEELQHTNYLPRLLRDVVTNSKLAVELTRYQSSLTMDKARAKPSISQLTAQADERGKEGLKVAQDIIVSFLKYMQNTVNVTNKMTELQLAQCSIVISTEYRQLTFEDLLIWMKKFLKGDYGQLYNRLDMTVICNTLTQYMASDEYIHSVEKQATSYKSERDDVPYNEIRDKWINKIINDFDLNKKIVEENKRENEMSSFEKWMEKVEGFDLETLNDLRAQAVIRGQETFIKVLDRLIYDRSKRENRND